MQDWLDDNDVLIYTTHNEGNSVIPETFIEILKTDYYLILIILLWLKKAETNAKVRSKVTVNDRVRITKCKNIFSEGHTENCSREIFIIDSVLKTYPWTYKAKDSNKRKNNDYYEKEFLLSKLKMSFYPEPDSNLRDKFKVVLDLSNYVTENN